MTIAEFIAAVKEGLNVQSDDTTVNDRYVFFIVKNMRATIIRQEANKDHLWDGANAQLVTDFELERSSISESKAFTAPTVVFKSVKEVPALVDTKFGKIILGVYFDNGSKLQKTEYVDWLAAQKRRNTLPTKPASYFIRNNRLYVVGYDPLADTIVVFIEGVFDNPEDVASEIDYIGDIEFKMPSYVADRVIKMTIDFIRGKYAIPNDTKNNAREDVQVTNTQT